MLHTTFSLARQAKACDPSVAKMRAVLGPDWADDRLIPLTLVLEHRGVEDATWALRCTVEPSERLARLFACDCAERVLPLFERQFPDDARPRQAIEVARRFALGEASAEARVEARAAARAAAEDAAYAAYAARDAVRAAAWAEAAAWAAWAAADAAAADAADAAAADAADAADAERQWQAQRLREMLEEHNLADR